jgi:hypothetical protein
VQRQWKAEQQPQQCEDLPWGGHLQPELHDAWTGTMQQHQQAELQLQQQLQRGTSTPFQQQQQQTPLPKRLWSQQQQHLAKAQERPAEDAHGFSNEALKPTSCSVQTAATLQRRQHHRPEGANSCTQRPLLDKLMSLPAELGGCGHDDTLQQDARGRWSWLGAGRKDAQGRRPGKYCREWLIGCWQESAIIGSRHALICERTS